MENKKAELTSSQLVGIILLVIVFVLLLFIMYIIYDYSYKTIDKETCHESVLLRHTLNLGPFEAGRENIPLKCETEKICLKKEENCEQYEGEDRITKVKLDKDNFKAREEIKDTIADAMYDCHSMLGEGKLNFMPHKVWEKTYCLICSRIALDEKTLELVEKGEIDDISYYEMYKYLENKKTPGGMSYLEYIYPGWENAEVAKVLFDNMKESERKGMKFEDWKINLDYEGGYAIISQIQTDGRFTQYLATGAVVGVVLGASVTAVFTGGLSLLTVPAAIGFFSTGVAGAGVLGGVTYIITSPNGSKYTSPAIYPYSAEDLRNLQCTSFETAP